MGLFVRMESILVGKHVSLNLNVVINAKKFVMNLASVSNLVKASSKTAVDKNVTNKEKNVNTSVKLYATQAKSVPTHRVKQRCVTTASVDTASSPLFVNQLLKESHSSVTPAAGKSKETRK